MITESSILESVKATEKWNDTIYFNGDLSVITSSNLFSDVLAKELNYFKVKSDFCSVYTLKNISISQGYNPNYVTFASNDLRLYDLFGNFMRKARIPVMFKDFIEFIHKRNLNFRLIDILGNDNNGDNKSSQRINIYLPEYNNFNAIKHVLNSTKLFLEYSSKLDSVDPKVSCAIRGCANVPMYYPNICCSHIHHLPTEVFDKIINNQDFEISINQGIDIRRLFLKNILEKVVSGYRIIDDDYFQEKYNGSECLICGDVIEKNNIYPPGFCPNCYLYIDKAKFEADYNNGTASIEIIRNKLWKTYLVYSLKYIRSQVRKRKSNDKTNGNKRSNKDFVGVPVGTFRGYHVANVHMGEMDHFHLADENGNWAINENEEVEILE